MTMTLLRDTALVKSLLLLILGITLLREVAARKNPKARDNVLCPPLEDNSVRVDIHILSQKQGVSMAQNFQNRSISPWDYNITRDPHRFPAEIAEANCRLSGCLNAQGQEDRSLNSRAIEQEFLVLRREPGGCPRSFRLEKVRVKVGCTCVRPIVLEARDVSAARQLS